MKELFLSGNLIRDIDKEEFRANCKFGTKPLKLGDFHHGLYRAYMKFLEDYNSVENTPLNIFEDFEEKILR